MRHQHLFSFMHIISSAFTSINSDIFIGFAEKWDNWNKSCHLDIHDLCVCVCVCVITVNRGHTPKLHIQTEDNIANEDGPRFVDTCKRLQIA